MSAEFAKCKAGMEDLPIFDLQCRMILLHLKSFEWFKNICMPVGFREEKEEREALTGAN